MTVAAASYWSFRTSIDDEAEDDLTDCARGLLNAHRHGWEWRRMGMWVRLTPLGVEIPAQGWKLHLSAMSRSASDVLTAVMPLLLREAVPFKFAATRSWVKWLNTANTPRESAGKFMTIYPVDDAQAIRIAQACDRATERFAGPAILSDRAVRPGSVVHYRYGAFRGAQVFNNDGDFVDVIHDPDSNPVPDERRAWFTPAAWATDPFITAEQPHHRDSSFSNSRPSPPKAVLLNGRYVVGEVLKHANKGGVYLAEDRTTGNTVVIKEARAHVEAPNPTGDVAGVLRHEARLLGLLAPLRLTPQPLEVFEQQGNLFLVLEHFSGQVLRDHVGQRIAETGRGLGAEEVRAMIRQLAQTMQTLHDADVLLRDFTPNNLMVLPDGQLRMVDLELAHLLSDGAPPESQSGTPGYGSPQQMAGRPSGLPDDYYSLGATIAYVTAGATPFMAPDRGQIRSLSGRLRDWVTGVERDGLVSERVCDLVLGCMADDLARRWGPRQVLGAIAQPHRPSCSHEPPSMSTTELFRAVDDIGRWLKRTVIPGGEFLWPTNCSGLRMDPCNVQSGASGVGLFLCQASQAKDDPELLNLVRTAAKWVSDTVAAEPRRPPGLYFGLSGAAWFLAEVSGCLQDPALLDRASELALTVPTSSFNPDITHGTAGIGLGQLHLWSLTGDGRFLDRADLAARALVTASRPGPDGVVWPVPSDVESNFAGHTFYGFAHGNAGITHFLLCATAALGEGRYRDLALEGLETLLRTVRLQDGTANWDAGPGRPYAWPHWCNGASGVGSALIRAYAATRDERYRQMAERAVGAVMRTKWRSSLVQCHGLAGNAEFLLDLYDFTGEQRFRDLALQLAGAIYCQRVYDDGLLVFPDDALAEVTASYNTGLAGIGALLLRLLHGGPRLLMADDLLLRPSPAVKS